MDTSGLEETGHGKAFPGRVSQDINLDSMPDPHVRSTTMQRGHAGPSEHRDSMMNEMEKVENCEATLNKHTRTLSLDSQTFLSHVLSVDGDELYNLLLSEPGATSHSPGKTVPLARQDSDGTMLADLMHTLMEDPQFQAQPDQRGEENGSIPLFSDKTLNAVLGEEFREIATDIYREQEARIGKDTSGPSLVALPTPQEQQQKQKQQQQFLTLLDGTVLQRDNGSPVIATIPEGQVELTVPLPGSSSMLQYIPVLNSTVIPDQPVLKPQEESRQPEESPFQDKSSVLLSPSQTEEIIAAAAKQHSELQEASRGVLPKPQLRPIDSSDLETIGASVDQGGLLSRKVSHKRERSLNTTRLMSSESLLARESKIINNSGNLDAQASTEFLEKISPNSPLDNSKNEKDAKAELGLYIKPIKLFSDGLEFDDDIAKIIDETLATPPGARRRGRPPGRSKHADIIPGFVEPTDAEILANLLLENSQLKSVSTDELKKLIRKEKNKISAAISRYRIQYETKVLEGKLKKLEQEKLSLSQWLQTTPEIQPHRMLLADGHNVPITGDDAPRPPIRHLSL